MPPVFSTSYRAGLKDEYVWKSRDRQNDRTEVTEPAQTYCAAPTVLVHKKGETLQFCFNYRKLNTQVKSDAYLILLADECMYFLGEATVISSHMLTLNTKEWELTRQNDIPKVNQSYESRQRFLHRPNLYAYSFKNILSRKYQTIWLLIVSRHRTRIWHNRTEVSILCMGCTTISSISARNHIHHQNCPQITRADPNSSRKYIQTRTKAFFRSQN